MKNRSPQLPVKNGSESAFEHVLSSYMNSRDCSTVALNLFAIKCPGRFRQQGLTLVELMISLLIGAFLVGGILQIFLSTKKTYAVQENLSEIQENVRFASEFLNESVRQAGYQGCRPLNVTADSPILQASAPTNSAMVGLTINTAVVGHEWVTATSTRSPAVNANISNIVAGTDVITLAAGESCGGFLSANLADATAAADIALVNTNSCTISDGTALIISDCSASDIIRATTGATKTTVKHAGQVLSKAYAAGAEVMIYHEYSYYIRNGADGRPALWRRDNAADQGSNNPSEMLSGVEDLQITYGVETDAVGNANYGAPNYYTTANNVPSMSQVTSVRLSLLLASSGDNITEKPISFTFNSTNASVPTDRRIRRVVDSVVAIRNRSK